MTIIDSELARSLNVPLEYCTPMSVAGIGSHYLFFKFIRFNVYFRRIDNVACVPVEVYLVDNLKAKLLVGMDVMAHKGF